MMIILRKPCQWWGKRPVLRLDWKVGRVADSGPHLLVYWHTIIMIRGETCTDLKVDRVANIGLHLLVYCHTIIMIRGETCTAPDGS